MGYTKAQREAKLAAQNNNTEPGKVVETKVKHEPIVEKKKASVRNLPLYTPVWVTSNCYGELIYVSKTGNQIVWSNFRSKHPVSLDELLVMRNTQRTFFEKNWIMISGFADPEFENEFSVEEILEFLQIKQYYSSVLCPEDIEDVFKLSADEIEKRVPNMSSGVKNAILIRANDLIQSGELDSLRVITALEKSLGNELSKPY